MAQRWIRRGAAHILWIAMLALWLPAAADAQVRKEDPYQLEKLAFQLRKAGKYDEALAAAERIVQLQEQHKEAKGALASALGSEAWYALFAKQPEKALAASERALKLAPHASWIEANRALALLFLGRTEEARAIYLSHKGERIKGHGKWEVAIAKGFQEFRSHGLGLPAMVAIEKALAAAPDSALAQSTAELNALSDQIGKLREKGKYAEAIPLAEKLLAAYERVLGKEHPDTLTSVNNLAALYSSQGRYAEAEPLYRRAFETRERVLGKEHPDTLTSFNNLAMLHYEQGRYAEAEPLLRRALEASERVLGKEHPNALTTLSNLAGLYEAQGRYAEAEPLHRRALETRERVLGKEHPDTLVSVNNLAALYGAQGRYTEAEPLYRRALEARERVLGKEHPDTLTSVNNLAGIFLRQGRYTEAEPLLRRALEARERVLGKEHPLTLSSVSNLAFLHSEQGRYDKAEPLYRRVLKTRERVLGKEHPNTLTSISDLAGLYSNQGRYAEAELLYRRALKAQEPTLGKEHPDTLLSVNNLALLLQKQGRFAEAEPLLRHVLEVKERVVGKEHPDTLASVNNLAELYVNQGRYAEAEPLHRRALETRERVLGKEHPDTLIIVNNLAMLSYYQGRYAEAEPLLRRVLETQERVLGKEHPLTLNSVNNLAGLYEAQGRYTEAEPLYRRALETYERVLGKEHPNTLTALNNLAGLYEAQGRYDKAEPLYHRALEARERALGKEHPDTLSSVNNLAGLYSNQDRYAEAEPLLRRGLENYERVLGKEHPLTLTSVSNLGALYLNMGRYDKAEPLLHRALEARERVLGKEHPDTLLDVNALAVLYLAQHNWSRAATFWRRSTASIAARTLRGALEADVAGKRKSESERLNQQFRNLVKALYRLAPDGRAPNAAVARETFQTAQWALSSEAARSMAQMAARSASGDPRLAALARERQDLVEEWQKLEVWRNAALGKEASKRNAKAEAENNARMAAIGKRIGEIDKRLKAEFPDYTALASPAPISVEDVQAQLHADEALVLYLDTEETKKSKATPEETFIWVVTKTGLRWVRSDLGTKALNREVQTLRCGLDASGWYTPHCAKLTGADYSGIDVSAGKPLPFDHARAYNLYKALFGQVEDAIKDKKLLIVPSGPLTQLPFQVLVTVPPSEETDNKSAAWFARDHAVTILPAVSSLKALRRHARASTAAEPMIGFGDPLLDGQQNDPQYGAYYKKLAKQARDNQQCGKAASQPVAAERGLHGGMKAVDTRGGLAQIAFIRMQTPLPETTDELCTVARDLKADASELRLGVRATEHEVKALSMSGQLAQYRIVHFATHGALAGELRGVSEPGLILTPPMTASKDDDGYLSAGEIAALKLNADWVILSACNTAAGNADGAEALSGLARAFIYAQARTLLVSHWAVDSDATVKLITGAMREMANDPKVGRAEALRRSMLALIDKGNTREAHPANWAPFIVVGEGAR